MRTYQSTLLQRPADGFHLVCKGEHSAKPVEGYQWFEDLFPAPVYADFFSRYQHNERWDPHGNEAPLGTAVLPAEAAE
jgi:hypothetical protein